MGFHGNPELADFALPSRSYRGVAVVRGTAADDEDGAATVVDAGLRGWASQNDAPQFYGSGSREVSLSHPWNEGPPADRLVPGVGRRSFRHGPPCAVFGLCDLRPSEKTETGTGSSFGSKSGKSAWAAKKSRIP